MSNGDDEGVGKKLTRFELTVLRNQFLILEKLSSIQHALKAKDRYGDHDWIEAVNVFGDGYELDYEQHLVHDITPYPQEAGEEAFAILNMFEALRRASSPLRFEGFGRDEHEHRGYAERFAASERFVDVLNADPALAKSRWLNRESKLLPRYRRMLMVYNDDPKWPLAPEMVKRIEAVAAKSE